MLFTSCARLCLAAFIWILAAATQSDAASPSDRWYQLSQREKTFLQLVFNGDEAKSVEYAQVAGINPNAIGGEPLSVWFYRMGNTGRGPLYQVNAQRIVFERFRQNPNPQNIGQSMLGDFCANAPYSQDLQIQAMGMTTGAQAFGPRWEAVQKAIADQQRPEIEAMAARLKSLIAYGLRDKTILRSIFVGCLGRRNFNITPNQYDLLITPMIQAGMNINMPLQDGRPAIENFVRAMDYLMVERIIKDGARLDITVRAPGCGRPSNLYVYFMNNLRPRDPTPQLAIVQMLSRAGVSPLKPIAYGGYQCQFRSLYDAALDTGNLRYAESIKAMAESGEQQRAAATRTQPTVPPKPAAAQTPAAPPAPTGAQELQIDQWRIMTQNGRLTAIAKSEKPYSDNLAALWIECTPGGRLEYVAISLDAVFKELRTLSINSAGDVYTFPLQKGRASGQAAINISKQLLAEERAYLSQGPADKWSMAMSIDNASGPMSEMQLGGFSKARAYMLSNCKG